MYTKQPFSLMWVVTSPEAFTHRSFVASADYQSIHAGAASIILFRCVCAWPSDGSVLQHGGATTISAASNFDKYKSPICRDAVTSFVDSPHAQIGWHNWLDYGGTLRSENQQRNCHGVDQVFAGPPDDRCFNMFITTVHGVGIGVSSC